MTLRPSAVALRPRDGSLGHALLGSPTRGPMGCPGGRQGRAHPAHQAYRKTPTTLPALRTRTQASRPRTGGERPVAARWACAANAQPQQERLGVEGHRDGPRAAVESWRDPVALLIAVRAGCRSGRRTIG